MSSPPPDYTTIFDDNSSSTHKDEAILEKVGGMLILEGRDGGREGEEGNGLRGRRQNG
jgi:hypothetical protein